MSPYQASVLSGLSSDKWTTAGDLGRSIGLSTGATNAALGGLYARGKVERRGYAPDHKEQGDSTRFEWRLSE